MSEQGPFQEKPDWKGQLKQVKSRIAGTILMLFKKGQKDGDDSRSVPPLSSSSTIPSLQNAEPTERTLTGRIANTWQTKVSPKLSHFTQNAFNRKKGDGAPGLMGIPGSGGGATARPQISEGTLNTVAITLAILAVTYTGADLTALLIDQFIPEPPPSRSAGVSEFARRMRSMQEYEGIITRNLFNRRGLVPGDDLPATPTDNNNTPVKTTLPFNLVGTLVLKNELRSIATIEDTSEQRVYPVRVDDEIPNRARIISIEPFRVIFVNPSTGRREFVEIAEEPGSTQISLSQPKSTARPAGGGVEKLSDTNFNVNKVEIQKSLSNWEEVLTQARAVPHTENGQPAGWMLLQIVPGSIYDKLGLKNRDIIRAVDGEPVNDVGKAMALLQKLQTTSGVEIQVTRQGKTSNITYNIR